MNNELQTMGVLKQALVTQGQQSEALIAVIERMEEQEKRVDKKINEVEQLVKAVDEKVHLDDKEAYDIQKLVGNRSSEFAKIFLEKEGYEVPFDTNIFLAKVGQVRSVIYRRLKHKFGVTKYTHIRHTQFNEAVEFLNDIKYSWLTEAEVRWTPRQLELLNERSE